MADDPRFGWFADIGHPDDDGYDEYFPWRPYLQTPGGCFPLDGIWFTSETDCEDFIRTDIRGQQVWIQEPEA